MSSSAAKMPVKDCYGFETSISDAEYERKFAATKQRRDARWQSYRPPPSSATQTSETKSRKTDITIPASAPPDDRSSKEYVSIDRPGASSVDRPGASSVRTSTASGLVDPDSSPASGAPPPSAGLQISPADEVNAFDQAADEVVPPSSPPSPSPPKNPAEIVADSGGGPQSSKGLLQAGGSSSSTKSASTTGGKTPSRTRKPGLCSVGLTKNLPPRFSEDLRALCRKGLPDSRRAEVWAYCLGSDVKMRDNPGEFERLVALSSTVTEKTATAIEVDLERTYPNHDV